MIQDKYRLFKKLKRIGEVKFTGVGKKQTQGNI